MSEITPMTPQEALAKLARIGENNRADFDDGDLGWFGWSVDTEHPETGVLSVTWQPEAGGAPCEKQAFTWELRLLAPAPLDENATT